jgi:hypothetical protein
MFQNKTDIIILFLLYIIFAEKILDHHHHVYNRRSEIIHMICNGTAEVWRSITKINPRDGVLSYLINSMHIIDAVKLSIFTCRILDTWRSIVLANYLYCNVLSNKFQPEVSNPETKISAEAPYRKIVIGKKVRNGILRK